MALTGADGPDMLREDAPVLSAAVIQGGGRDEMYIIGLIGGKEVGKSSFVNALVGQEITPPSSHGPGTDVVVAYAHEAMVQPLRELLEREVPGRYRMYAHQIERLRRQVLLDLPDIDSHYADHIDITRRMLRHMLYPIWIQSIEKYADQRPQTLLLRVAEGNDPANFIFCLNKVDQVIAHEGLAAAGQIRDDYAQRLMRALRLAQPPRVHLVSATHPHEHDFPALRKQLSEQRANDAVRTSQQLASAQQDRSILVWLREQQLPEQAARAARLADEAHELIAARVATPLLEEALPRLADDPAQRLAMVDPVVRARIARWPIISIIDGLLAPLLVLVQKNLGAATVTGAPLPIDSYLQHNDRPLAAMIQGTFAQLRQSHPLIADLYAHRRLWDDHASDMAAMELRQRIGATLQRQRTAALARFAGRYGIISPLVRWLLTIGALLWFPFAQPVTEAILAGTIAREWGAMLLFIVRTLSATWLLRSLGFLMLWYLVLWMVLRWDTQGRANRQIERWKRSDGENAATSPAAQVIEWVDELLEPIRSRQRQVESVARRADELEKQLSNPRSAA